MPKHSRDSAHLFITQALTNQDVNLSVYKDDTFKSSLRLVAVDSILSILQQIHSKRMHAQQHGEIFNIKESINQIHPITRLNMLDYCLAAGFDDMAITLVHHGAESNNLQSFRHNVNTSFPNGITQPEIVQDIRTIINGCMEIKHNYDQFVNKTNAVLPKMVSAGQRIYSGYSTPALIMVGIGGVLLAPFLQPLIHGVGATAMLVSAGFLPAVISGVYSATREKQQPPQLVIEEESLDELETLKYLVSMAKNIKSELLTDFNNKHTPPQHSKHKKRVLHHPPQAPLLFQLSKNEKHKKDSNPAAVAQPHQALKKAFA